MRHARPLPALLLLLACRTSFDPGPLRAGDERLALHRAAIVQPSDAAPPPPPVDTLALLRLRPVGGAASSAGRALGVRARYHMAADGRRGWIAFPQERQPTGVTADPAARIVIHDGRIGGVGTLTLRDERGTLVIDLGRHLRGEGSEIRGGCRGASPTHGACATLAFDGVPYAPASGAARDERFQLMIGAPSP